MGDTCQSFRRNKASGPALRNFVAPLCRQRELAVVVFLAFFCGSIAGTLLFAPHHQSERMGFVAPKTISGISEQHAPRYPTKVGVTSAHAIDFDRDAARALNAAQRQFLQQQLSESEAALLSARAKTSSVLARAAALKDLASQDSELQITQVTKRDDATLLADLKNTLLALQLKHREMLTKYAPTYPLVQEVEAQIADAQNAILDAQQSPIQEVTTAKTPRQDWIATELAKAQVDRSGLEAEAAADNRTVKHFENSLQNFDHSLAFEQESDQDAKKSCDVLLTSDSQSKATDAAALYAGSPANLTFAQTPSFDGATSAVHWWPISALIMAALAGILAAFLTDSFRALFRGSA
jgi:hypothetical protein